MCGCWGDHAMHTVSQWLGWSRHCSRARTGRRGKPMARVGSPGPVGTTPFLLQLVPQQGVESASGGLSSRVEYVGILGMQLLRVPHNRLGLFFGRTRLLIQRCTALRACTATGVAA
jgi:hypothetical protein